MSASRISLDSQVETGNEYCGREKNGVEFLSDMEVPSNPGPLSLLLEHQAP